MRRKPSVSQSFGFTRMSLATALVNRSTVEGYYWFKYRMNYFRGLITSVSSIRSDPKQFYVNGENESGEGFFGAVWVDD